MSYFFILLFFSLVAVSRKKCPSFPPNLFTDDEMTRTVRLLEVKDVLSSARNVGVAAARLSALMVFDPTPTSSSTPHPSPVSRSGCCGANGPPPHALFHVVAVGAPADQDSQELKGSLEQGVPHASAIRSVADRVVPGKIRRR